MKYTKGEWELRGNKIFIAGTYNSIATVHIQKSWDEQIRPIEDAEAKANAKLIRVAPKLLEACQKTIQAFKDAPASWCGTEAVMEAESIMVDAIKKAI